MTLIKHFEKLQTAMETSNQERHESRHEWLMVSEVERLLSVDFYGDPYDEHFETLLDTLSQDVVATRLYRLFFHSPDVGANGTRNWDFRKLLDNAAAFPNLNLLSIEQYDSIGHNHPIVGTKGYEEQGMLAKWLSKAPQLKFLSAPSAPNKAFFENRHSLERLHLQAGCDTQNFVLNFAQSDSFPELWRLDYQDYHAPYIENYQSRCTPLEHFYQLFKSAAFDSIRTFVWHNPIFTTAELSGLKALRPHLHFVVGRTSKEFI